MGQEVAPLSSGPAAAQKAAQERLVWLLSVRRGEVPADFLFRKLQQNREQPVRRLTISEVLQATGNFSPAATATAIKQMLAVLGDRTPPAKRKKLSLAWLLDQKSGGRRAAVFEDTLAPKELPWPGYPLAGRPTVD